MRVVDSEAMPVAPGVAFLLSGDRLTSTMMHHPTAVHPDVRGCSGLASAQVSGIRPEQPVWCRWSVV